MKIIGIDIGTTSISIVLISLPEGTLLQAVTLPNDTFLPTAHPWERLQDPAAILAIVLPALDGLLSACSDVAAIGLTGQMHGIVYLNNAGSPVSPLFTWQDGRGNLPDYDNGKSVCSCMDEGYGIKLATGYGLATHLYNLKKGLVPTDAASFCTIADYVGMALTGRGAPLLHISQAASLGLYDSKANDFMRDIITENGIPLDFLPAVTKETVSLGSFRGIPVSVSIGDNQASFMGSVGKDTDCILVNIGTGSQISVLSHSFFQGKGIEARPFTADSYLLAGAALCGGSAYAALERFFREYIPGHPGEPGGNRLCQRNPPGQFPPCRSDTRRPKRHGGGALRPVPDCPKRNRPLSRQTHSLRQRSAQKRRSPEHPQEPFRNAPYHRSAPRGSRLWRRFDSSLPHERKQLVL